MQEKNYLDICKEIAQNHIYIQEYTLIYKIGVLYDLYTISSQEIKKIIKDKLNIEILSINNKTIKKLLETAFLFASLNSTDIENYHHKENLIEEIDNLKNQAYRIAISIYYYGQYLKQQGKENEGFFGNNNIIYRLFTRLGILTKARDEKIDDIDIFSLDLHGKIEAINKEFNNKFCIQEELQKFFRESEKLTKIGSFKNDEVFFSDFQNMIIKKLMGPQTLKGGVKGYSIAISAPTSAGKTFIIKKYIMYKIWENYLLGNKINIVFIVPSKALINELKNDFIELFREYNINENICNLHSYISGNDFIENYRDKSNLFIFTQERLNYFYNEIKNNGKGTNFIFNLVIVDEAHKVGYGYRGTLLSYIISKIKSDNKNIQIVLLAPLLTKLNKFIKEFGLSQLEENFSNFGLVAKNEIMISFSKIQNKLNTYNITYYLKILKQEIELFNNNYTIEDNLIKLKDNDKKISFLANEKLIIVSKFFSSGLAQSIIFNFGADTVIKQALKLKKTFKNNDQYLNKDLVNYISDILPPSLGLSEILSVGVAYHNGKLPTVIKSLIEKQFKKNNIKYLVANYTVLEGVNLPAKNIFIGHSEYNKKELTKLDVKNLIGRSGRLNEHLSGNVFFVSFNTKKERETILNNTLTEALENNISNTLNDNEEQSIGGKTKFDRFLDYIKPGSIEYKSEFTIENSKNGLDQERKDFEYMLGYLVSKVIDENTKDYDTKKQNQLIGIESILTKRLKEYNLNTNRDDIFSNIGDFIYQSGNIKEEKINNLRISILAICDNDLNIRTGGDIDFLSIIKKNIFIDPRKQLDFYELVKSGSEGFIQKNIFKYEKIISLLSIKDKKNKKILLKNLLTQVQKYFINKYKINDINYYAGDYIYSGTVIENILPLLNQWISSISLKKILDGKVNYIRALDTINKEIQFNYMNAFSIYFELANLGYKKYLEENMQDLYEQYKESDNFPKFDLNFIYYMELGTFYPLLIYLISQGVSRETAIWLSDQKELKLSLFTQTPKEDLNKKRQSILKYLEAKNKNIIIEELEKFIY